MSRYSRIETLQSRNTARAGTGIRAGARTGVTSKSRNTGAPTAFPGGRRVVARAREECHCKGHLENCEPVGKGRTPGASCRGLPPACTSRASTLRASPLPHAHLITGASPAAGAVRAAPGSRHSSPGARPWVFGGQARQAPVFRDMRPPRSHLFGLRRAPALPPLLRPPRGPREVDIRVLGCSVAA